MPVNFWKIGRFEKKKKKRDEKFYLAHTPSAPSFNTPAQTESISDKPSESVCEFWEMESKASQGEVLVTFESQNWK